MFGMISKSILTYTLFRTTRSITKGGFDSFGGVTQRLKVTTCEECGRVFGGEILECPSCKVETEKLYYEHQNPNGINLIDNDLDMVG